MKMKNKKILSITLISIIMLSLVGVLASNIDWLTHSYDRLIGSNLEVTEFSDELGIIDSLVYNDQIKRNRNSFKSSITYKENDNNTFFNIDNFNLDGTIYFDDRSKVVYELEDFDAVETYVDYEDNYAEIEGQGILKYKAVLVIEREIPVNLYGEFYQDSEDKSYQDNYIEMIGNDLNIVLENGNVRHRHKCYLGCD